MSSEKVWHCIRQRAGPLVKECRSIRPRIASSDTVYERTEKNKILRPPRDSSVCRTRVDRLELRLALFECAYKTGAVDAIGKPVSLERDGPQGLTFPDQSGKNWISGVCG